MPTMTIAQCLRWATQQLAASESPAVDAKFLLCHVLDCANTYLMTYPEQMLSNTAMTKYQNHVDQRKQGIPVSYIIGKQDFWTLTLQVNEHTLIPRPETELLVEQTLHLNNLVKPQILDLGTGTGAVALALASELPQANIYAVDRIIEAVELAQLNAQQLQLSNVQIFQSDWFAQLTTQAFDFIVTNPPYVESESRWLGEGDVRFEPLSALVAGSDGLDDIRYIIEHAKAWLKPGAWLLIEHGYNQADLIAQIFKDFEYQAIQCLEDYSSIPRISFAQKRVA